MAVAVKQIPGTNFQSANLDRFAEIDDVGIGVRNREIPAKTIENSKLLSPEGRARLHW